MDMPIGFHRLTRTPLDQSCVIDGDVNNKLFDYLQNGAAYDGQLITLNYPTFRQPIIVTKTNNRYLPYVILQSGVELIVKTINANTHILVYYYNGGKWFDNKNDAYRMYDAQAWGMLPLASLFACTNDDINWILEYNGSQYSFVQTNFWDHPFEYHGEPRISVSNIYTNESDKGYYTTYNPDIVILPKLQTSDVVKLWVRAVDYVTLLRR